MTPYHDANGITIYHGDCLDVMRALPDGCADLIVADPPYYRVKDSWWDNQWKTPAAFLEWLGLVVDELARLMKPNGSLYLFASPQMAARVEVLIAERLNVLNGILWLKNDNGSRRHDAQVVASGMARSYFPDNERIIFAEHYGSDGHAMNGAGYDQKCDELRGFVFEPLRAYLAGERDRAGWQNSDINDAWCELKGVNSTSQTQKWFSSSCFNPPTLEAYLWLRSLFNMNGGDYLQRNYEDLRTQYEDLRTQYEELRTQYEELRRPFNMTAKKQFTDVWEFTPVLPYPNKHECEKPPALLSHIIDVSSRPGAVVFDPFLGSGRSLEVARQMGRTGIGIEVQEVWCRRAAERCSQLSLFDVAA